MVRMDGCFQLIYKLFIALRSRFSLSSTECKLYRFGLLLISLGPLLWMCSLGRLSVEYLSSGDCRPEWLWLHLPLLIHDIVVSAYSLCVFIVPLKKLLVTMQSLSGDMKALNLFANKVVIYR